MLQAGHRKRRQFARVGSVPSLTQQRGGGVGCVAQRVVVLWPFAAFHLGNLATDGDHGVDKAIEFMQCFALGGFHHQGAWHRKTQRGGMKPVIHQTFAHVFGRDTMHAAAGLFERTQVQDALVRHPAGFTSHRVAGVERRVMVF